MLALAGENRDERHVGHDPTSVFVGLVHVHLLNTYFVPAAILGTEQDRQNRQSLCSCGIYMLVVVKRQSLTKKMSNWVRSANER